MNNYKNWTDREIYLLKQAYKKAVKKGVLKINFPSELLQKRTRSQCVWQARRFGIQRSKKGGYTLPFTKNVSEKDLAYTAGIIDGEGWITMIRGDRKKNNRSGQYFIGVANTDRKLIEYLKKTIGGYVFEREVHKWESAKKYKKIKRQYEWRLSGIKTVISFLKIILPFLIIKRIKAIKAIKMYEK